jgi:hypothetical protein
MIRSLRSLVAKYYCLLTCVCEPIIRVLPLRSQIIPISECVGGIVVSIAAFQINPISCFTIMDLAPLTTSLARQHNLPFSVEGPGQTLDYRRVSLSGSDVLLGSSCSMHFLQHPVPISRKLVWPPTLAAHHSWQYSAASTYPLPVGIFFP